MADPMEREKFNENSAKISDDNNGITMLDVLEEEQELEEDANAVLGGSDDQNCTYPLGFVKRQALYACSTCTEGKQTLAGVCLACSYACHEGHRLFELYTKRNFRCDCGNSKFPSNSCKLYSDKDPLNLDNNYNHNFSGVYCTCEKPYPDPDDDIEDEMIQCVICEDWYHGRHLGTPVPVNNEYGEMICGQCMTKYDFLRAYLNMSNETCKVTPNIKDEDVDVDHVSVDVSDQLKVEQNGVTNSSSNEIKNVMQKEPVDPTKANECLLNQLSTRDVEQRAIFWPDGWRNKLCRCVECKRLYEEKHLSFLLNDEDTVHSYEEQGKAKTMGQSRYDQGMQALSQLDRVKQVEAITEYNDMKMELKDFLKDFANSKKLVRKEDIEEFFTQMRQRKRQRLEVSIPHYCR